VLSVLPFNNTVDKLIMTGEQIRNVLENVADGLCPGVNLIKLFFLIAEAPGK
jgi:hypothetical protein